MEINLDQIYTGWKNSLNYNKLPLETKKLIDVRSKFCMGTKDDLSDKCEHFVYSPIYRMVERIINAPKRIITWVQNLKMHKEIDHPNGITEPKTVMESTGEVLGIQGFKCNLCGCDTAAKISNPEVHCPLNPPKW